MTAPLHEIITANHELQHCAGTSIPIVLSTRIRLARNLDGINFPGWAEEEVRSEVYDQVVKALLAVPQMKGATVGRISEMKPLERQMLLERHLVSRELVQSEQGSGVVVSRDQSCAVMVNEEDHLRIQMINGGFRLQGLWRAINALDSSLEEHLDFAFSPQLGYLTACPTNLGTGLRASAMMHLPGLVLTEDIERVIRAVNQLGIAVRGLFGEGSDASGNIFQISNQQTLGETEEEIIDRLTDVLRDVITQENNARMRLLESSAVNLFDKIGRAYGMLCHAYLLSSDDAMNQLSFLRLAVDLEMLPAELRTVIDRLLIQCQPGHVQYEVAIDGNDAEERDSYRAQLVREQLGRFPDLNFSPLGQTTPHEQS